MARMILTAVFGLATLGTAAPATSEESPPAKRPGDPVQPVTILVPNAPREVANAAFPLLRKLLLNAKGTQPVGPDQMRVPIPNENGLYEVIIAKPGTPRLVPLETSDGK